MPSDLSSWPLAFQRAAGNSEKRPHQGCLVMTGGPLTRWFAACNYSCLERALETRCNFLRATVGWDFVCLAGVHGNWGM